MSFPLRSRTLGSFVGYWLLVGWPVAFRLYRSCGSSTTSAARQATAAMWYGFLFWWRTGRRS